MRVYVARLYTFIHLLTLCGESDTSGIIYPNALIFDPMLPFRIQFVSCPKKRQTEKWNETDGDNRRTVRKKTENKMISFLAYFNLTAF